MLPEWARLRTFLKGIVTVTWSLVLGVIPFLIHFLLPPSPPSTAPVWRGYKGAASRWVSSIVGSKPVLFQNTSLCLHGFFSFLLSTGQYITQLARERPRVSEGVLEIKTDINLSGALT